ncbi:cyclin-D3-1-like isoform X2 [Juglans microcarpa x Juglans regia]|uniref:cyclin-D3-1-like isoform X2 n=1 Tax=Juglans microcarpa x Juglans regia TaxID=2249226 RepID=UPI001B7E2EDD|nr:cyclin-D3-1-like isoform X2 [Juglans microcarpa x Juglans regia]
MAQHHHHHQESIAQQHQQQNLPDVLYCSEEHWEEELGEDYFHEEDEVEDNSYGNSNEPSHFSVFLEQDLFWDDEARREAVEWMMKVNAHYSFSALTAFLAVNYFDRFLLSFHLHGEKPWMPQLAAVGCLSLAAKVEETQVPLLLDLQVEGCKYVFEAKAIKRMEILVLSTLQWKMNPVTPFSFLDYITRRLGSKDYLCWEFLRRCERVLLCVLADYRFMSYLPSVVATATMLHVVSTLEPCLVVEHQNQLLGILGIEKDRVDDCYKLIAEWASEGHGGRNLPSKRKFCSIPCSPKGVNDVSFSSDSSNDSWALAVPLVSSSPQPLSKKSRAHDQLLQTLNKSSADIFSIPR